MLNSLITVINKVCFVDIERLLPDTFTYTSQAYGTTSWLDHCITTTSGQSVISHVSVSLDQNIITN